MLFISVGIAVLPKIENSLIAGVAVLNSSFYFITVVKTYAYSMRL